MLFAVSSRAQALLLGFGASRALGLGHQGFRVHSALRGPTIGALIKRIRIWGPYYNSNKEPPNQYRQLFKSLH